MFDSLPPNSTLPYTGELYVTAEELSKFISPCIPQFPETLKGMNLMINAIRELYNFAPRKYHLILGMLKYGPIAYAVSYQADAYNTDLEISNYGKATYGKNADIYTQLYDPDKIIFFHISGSMNVFMGVLKSCDCSEDEDSYYSDTENYNEEELSEDFE